MKLIILGSVLMNKVEIVIVCSKWKFCPKFAIIGNKQGIFGQN